MHARLLGACGLNLAHHFRNLGIQTFFSLLFQLLEVSLPVLFVPLVTFLWLPFGRNSSCWAYTESADVKYKKEE